MFYTDGTKEARKYLAYYYTIMSDCEYNASKLASKFNLLIDTKLLFLLFWKCNEGPACATSLNTNYYEYISNVLNLCLIHLSFSTT